MKHFVIIVSILAFSLALQAQDEPTRPFIEMSYEELQGFDVQGLDKKQKKAHKKALKKAKKAHKKAKKAAAKSRKKREKAVRKKLKKFNRSYTKTKIIRDDFEATIEVAGKYTVNRSRNTSFLDALNTTYAPTEYFLRAFYNPATHSLDIQAFVKRKFSLEVPQAKLNFLEISPAAYATRKGWWANYTNAKLRGGITRNINRISKSTDSCLGGICAFLEKFAIDLNSDDMFNAIEKHEDLALKVNSANEKAFFLYIPADHMMGFLLKLSEADSKLAYLGKPGREFRAEITQELGR
ncbi:MAG: hypothetical protein COB37_10875 [Kordiimonadales bacterium]|nr:MAG: hypothetical protein COB37_10875 [Kordiimonadales bacterium]